MNKPNRKTVRDAIRGSVPDGKLKGARIVLSDAPYGQSAITGFTDYDRKEKRVIKLGAPDMDNAVGITVRGHETRHASKHRPRRLKPKTENEKAAEQIVDDVNVETMELPFVGTDGIEAYRRAHLATAMRDLKTLLHNAENVKRGLAKDDFAHRNNQLLSAMRVKAMLAHYREGGNSKTIQQAVRASRKLTELIGKDTSRALHSVINLAKSSRTRARAIGVLTALLESASPEDNDEQEGEKGKEPGFDLMPVTHGNALEGKMEILNLNPKTRFTAKERKVNRRYTPNGVIINPSRFVNAIASGDANGLFSQRVRHKAGGTVVIDASGSMGATSENLAALCALVPTATVAYYSGNDAGKGTLVIYALNGKRYSGSLESYAGAEPQGGNSVDLAAVRWLLEHEKPHTLISDLQFTGGVVGSETIAHAIVERAQKRGDLKVYLSLDEAYEAFGGKGDLSDAANKAQHERMSILDTASRLRMTESEKKKREAEAGMRKRNRELRARVRADRIKRVKEKHTVL